MKKIVVIAAMLMTSVAAIAREIHGRETYGRVKYQTLGVMIQYLNQEGHSCHGAGSKGYWTVTNEYTIMHDITEKIILCGSGQVYTFWIGPGELGEIRIRRIK